MGSNLCFGITVFVLLLANIGSTLGAEEENSSTTMTSAIESPSREEPVLLRLTFTPEEENSSKTTTATVSTSRDKPILARLIYTPEEENSHATTTATVSTSRDEPILPRLTVTPGEVSLPFNDSLTVSCDLLAKMAANPKLTPCKMTLFQIRDSGQNRSHKQRIPLAETVAGSASPRLLSDGSHHESVAGGTQARNLTMTIAEVTCAAAGTFGCDVTYILGRPRDSAQDAEKTCVNASLGMPSGDVLRSGSVTAGFRVEVLPREIILNASLNETSKEERYLILTCCTHTTEKIGRWIWEVAEVSGWHPIDLKSHDVNSDVIEGETSPCGLLCSTLRRKLKGSDMGRQYRCYVVTKRGSELRDLAAYYRVSHSEWHTTTGKPAHGESLSFTRVEGMQKKVSTLPTKTNSKGNSDRNRSRFFMRSGWLQEETAARNEAHSKDVMIIAGFSATVAVAVLLSVGMLGYYIRLRSSDNERRRRRHGIIREPFELQGLRQNTKATPHDDNDVNDDDNYFENRVSTLASGNSSVDTFDERFPDQPILAENAFQNRAISTAVGRSKVVTFDEGFPLSQTTPADDEKDEDDDDIDSGSQRRRRRHSIMREPFELQGLRQNTKATPHDDNDVNEDNNFENRVPTLATGRDVVGFNERFPDQPIPAENAFQNRAISTAVGRSNVVTFDEGLPLSQTTPADDTEYEDDDDIDSGGQNRASSPAAMGGHTAAVTTDKGPPLSVASSEASSSTLKSGGSSSVGSSEAGKGVEKEKDDGGGKQEEKVEVTGVPANSGGLHDVHTASAASVMTVSDASTMTASDTSAMTASDASATTASDVSATGE